VTGVAGGEAEGRGQFLPRKMDMEPLIRTLVEEHAAMKEGLRNAREAARRRDYGALAGTLRELDPLFRQHIVDEESTILRLLIGRLGVKGAEEEVRVFQQHRPIYRLMTKIAEFASMSAAELEAKQEELGDLFERHAAAEEGFVFPKATTLAGRNMRPGT
jgi:Hemerythrin HHE cation binding domain